MVRKISEHWFGISMLFLAVSGMLFIIIISVAPHDDAKMRGFAPCTYDMAAELAEKGSQKSITGVVGAVANSYICYAAVMQKGMSLWLERKQPTPWANYIFEAETFVIPPELSEPLPEDLLKANLLDGAGDEAKVAEGVASGINLGD